MSAFRWVAHYNDGRALYQEKPDGSKHTYADIERDKLVAFDLWVGDRLIVRVDLRPDRLGDSPKRLIWRMRHLMNDKGRDDVIHLVGWQRTVGGENVQAICYVFEDGAVLLSGEWGGEGGYMHPITLLECEKDLVAT